MKLKERVLTLILALSMGISASCISGLNLVASGDSSSPSANIDYIKGDDNEGKKFNLILTLRGIQNCTCAGLKFTYNPTKVSIQGLQENDGNLNAVVEVSNECNASLEANGEDGFTTPSSGEVTGVWTNFKAEQTTGAGGTSSNEEVELLYLVHPSIVTTAPNTVAMQNNGPTGYNITTTQGTENRLFSTTKDYKFLSIPFSCIQESGISDDTSEMISIESLQLDNDGDVKELVNNGLTIDTAIKEEKSTTTVTIHANGGTFKAANFADETKGILDSESKTLTVECDEEGKITLPNRVDITRPTGRMFLCWSTKEVNTNGPVNKTTVPDGKDNNVRYYSGEQYDSSNGLELYAVWALAGDINGDGKVNAQDRTMLLGQFGRKDNNNNKPDINGDGAVNAQDRTILLGNFGKEDKK